MGEKKSPQSGLRERLLLLVGVLSWRQSWTPGFNQKMSTEFAKKGAENGHKNQQRIFGGEIRAPRRLDFNVFWPFGGIFPTLRLHLAGFVGIAC